MVRRALVLRCPWCGSRRTFIRRWLGKHERCRTCGIRWRREEGFELGTVALNTVITFGALAIGMLVAFILTVPDVPVLRLVLLLSSVAIVVPVLVYPLTYTVWLAFDLATRRPSAAELAEARATVASD